MRIALLLIATATLAACANDPIIRYNQIDHSKCRYDAGDICAAHRVKGKCLNKLINANNNTPAGEEVITNKIDIGKCRPSYLDSCAVSAVKTKCLSGLIDANNRQANNREGE